MRTCENHKLRGSEAWRRLVNIWDPMSIGRKRDILPRVLNPSEVKLDGPNAASEAWTICDQ
eukprot:11679246-Prorocentrum_lima.AAC.1